MLRALQSESSACFMPDKFLKVARIEELTPGTMKQVVVDGHPILIANIDGTFYATDDTCTHEDTSLSRGHLAGGVVKCPLHNSRFNLRTGEVLEDPAEENLRTYPVRVDGSDILVGPARESA